MSSVIRIAVVVILAGVAGSALAQPNPAGFVPGHLFFTAVRGCSPDLLDTALRELDPVTGETWTWHTQNDGITCGRGLRFTPNGRYLRILDWGGSTIWDMDEFGQLVPRYVGGQGGPWGPLGANGLIWDRNGNFGVTDSFTSRFIWYQSDQLPPIVGASVGDGGLDISRNGSIFLASAAWQRLIPPYSNTILIQYWPSAVALSVAVDERSDVYVVVRVTNGNGRIFKYSHGDPTSSVILVSSIPLYSSFLALHMGNHRRTLYLASTSDIWSVDRSNGALAPLYHEPFETEFSLAHGLTSYDPPEPGDLNCDGWIDNFDIDPFILALTDPGAYDAQYFFCDRQFADLNGDAAVDLFDIDPFVTALLAPATP